MDDTTSKLRTFQLDNGITDIRDIKALLELTRLMEKQNFNLDLGKAVRCLFDPESEYEYSDMRPFQLNFDSNISIRALFDDLFAQAKQRQESNKKINYREILLRHLVEAVLSTVLPHRTIRIHNTAVADSPTDRGGDFVINNTIIHCTTAPGEPLIQKCKANIHAGCLPVIITIFDRVKTTFDLAADAGLSGRIEVWDIQQFLSTNISEHSLFDGTARNAQLADIVEKYNAIIEEVETYPSLRIEFEAK